MSDQDHLAYGSDYSQSRGPGDKQSGTRGFLNSAFKQAKNQYDKYSQKPTQNFGYGSSTTGQPQQTGQQQYGQGQTQSASYQPGSDQQSQPWGQPPQPGSYPTQDQSSYGSMGQQTYQPQQPAGGKPKADLASKLIGGLTGAVHTLGTDVGKFLGTQYPGGQAGTAGTQQGGAGQTRFGSFAIPKPDNQVKWYVDGCNYMWAVSQALENAKQSVWILDWWLSPELYLRRPPAANEMWRLDRVLQRAAQRGVKVNVIVYKEVTQALTMSSHHTKKTLEALSPNIGVFRHPDHLPDAKTTQSSIVTSFSGLKLDAASASRLGSDAVKGISGLGDVTLYWAHHEKLCLIDGQIAFMGGLDLCYGRWDTHQHSIADAHPSDLNKIVFPGQDFNNARVMDFNDVPNAFQNKLDRTKSSRMGWSDVSICLRGPCVEDLRTHFTDRWNFIYDEKYTVRKDVRYSRLPPTAGHVAGSPQNPAQSSNPQQNVPAGQFPPPPANQPYEPPSWQSGSYPQSSGIAATTTTAGSQNPETQSYPPPPPGGPAQSNVATQYGQGPQQPPQTTGTTQSSYQAQPTSYGHDQSQYQNAPASTQPSYGSYDHSTHQPQTQVYQDNSQTEAYGAQAPQHGPSTFPPPPVSHSPAPQQPYAPSPSHSPAPPAQQQYNQLPPQPPTYPQQYQTPPKSQSPAPQQQYQAYHGSSEPHPPQHQQGYAQQYPDAVELPAQQPDYNAYHPQPGTRGFGDQLSHFSHGQGHGQNQGKGQGGRFDQYKQESKLLGNELGAIGSMLQGKVEEKMGRPVSRSGSTMRCQVLRSSSKWSNGTSTEHSIQNAYIDVIEKSQHFIYIENQFFITATGDRQKPVKNLIGKAIVDRIVRAAREHTPFKVIVIMPAVPAFAGDLIDDASLGTRAICEFQYFSICRGGHSIMEEVQKAGINPMDYIRFYNLRNYDRINYTVAQTQAQQQSGVSYEDARKQQENVLGAGYAGQGYPGQTTAGAGQWQGNPAQQYQQAAQQAPNMAADRWDSVASCYMLGGEDIRNVPWSGPPEAEIDAFVSEELYVHSKIIIADDQVVICGSANINDRSMQGDHDSEIALLIYDTTPQQSMMAGRPWQATRFAASLRRQLFRKHLGLLPVQDYTRGDPNSEPVQTANTYDWGSPEDNLVTDPLADTFQSFWNTRARTNTEVFRKAFRAVPDDYVRSWAEYKEFFEYYFAKTASTTAGKAQPQQPAKVEYGHVVKSDFPGGVKELKELLSKVKGTLVEMPLCFLQTEDIAKEGMGLNIWTQDVYT